MDLNKLKLPLSDEVIKTLKKGFLYYISGTMFTARDRAHKRLIECISKGLPLPFSLNGACIYYAGPTPHNPNSSFAFGSVGPTTSLRMDEYTPTLVDAGVRFFVGKGQRSEFVADYLRKHGAVYFSSVGGAGAYLSSCIKSAELIAYEDLGCEAIYKLEVEDFPVFIM